MLQVTDSGIIDKTINYIVKLARQVPYGTALGINNTAVEAQKDTYENVLPSTFLLRNQWFKNSPLAFKIKPFASKENLQATLGSTADFLKLQEEGGEKTPTRSKALSLPTTTIRPDKSEILKGRDRPKGLFASGKAFFMETNGHVFLVKRLAKDRPGSRIHGAILEKGNLGFMFSMKPQGRIKKALQFIPKETEFVNGRIVKNVQEGIKKAIETAK